MSPDEFELAQAEKWATAEEELSVVRHDLRNRMGSIRNAEFYLARKVQKTEVWTADPRVSTFFKLIEDQLTSGEAGLARLTLVPYAQRPPAPTPLRAAVERALRTMTVPPNVTLTLALADDAVVMQHEVELAVAARCLLRNAVEAVAATGGTVAVTVSRTPQSTLKIVDSGKGIALDHEQRALSPFISDKSGHAGIGLNVARRLASRANGVLSFSRPSGGGFEVALRFSGAPRP